ncbi:uncharacterized protein B0I36DRAFT_147214 [Microdochium trichocladiopsis]|uniref:Uncharacterized protein n=1 Tax=Microdochium trichocladiopsis TaxID=1682393 RepID=A0A9P8Y540_9PEZI|nr:uncharacterized protein B0I36DRAFT_147214 [Microdochium trichocladiopsis]KAH7028107.1 hypothetical protein B0I36DRAFT_147214 [Microdochium trichocladiopsis]
MGQKPKSKFMFPIPGRKAKDASPTNISAPLSKAQRLLGTGEINIDHTGQWKGHEGWDAQSSGGISVSVSESSMGGRTNSTYRAGQHHGVPQLTINHRGWDEESDVVPRHLHSASGLGLRQQRSAATLGADYYSGDTATDMSSIRRRQSNSTINTHYDKSHVPLSVSQQTSNSAIALGPYFDQFHPDTIAASRKKRPSKLDLLRGKVRHDPPTSAKTASPNLGGGHTLVRSPSMMSFKSSWGGSTPNLVEQRTPKKLVRRSQQPALNVATQPTHHRPLRDAAGLHQLYDHYEEMSFRNAPSPTEEDDPSFLTSDPFETVRRPATAQTSVSLPAVKPMIREPQSPSDKSSTRTRNLTSGSGTTDPMDSTISSMTDYAASVSSRHTRTSKASRTDRSIQSIDRQQNSVLSLSDSDSDEDSLPRSSPSPHLGSSKAERNLGIMSAMDHVSYTPANDRSGIPNTAQIKPIKAYLDIPRTSSRTAASRSRSNSASHSQRSSGSTVSPYSGASLSSDGAQQSIRSRASDDESPRRVHEAQSVTLHPLASTMEAAVEELDKEAPLSDFQKMLSGPGPQGRTRDSRSSEQPTPPLSPNSVEFYFRSPESIRRDSAASNSSEKNNARFMAVTRQEEMLLAALREKRAKMRASSQSLVAAPEKGGRVSEASTRSPPRQSVVIPQRRSSANAADAVESADAGFAPNLLGTLQEEAPYTGATESQQSSPEGAASAPSSTRKNGKARQERVLLYLDRPISRVGAIDLAEPSPDLTEFMGSVDGRSDDEWAEDDRRTRVKSTRWTTFSKHGFFSNSDAGRPRADSAAVTPKLLAQAQPRLADLPESESEYEDDDLYLDDFDFNDFPEPGGKVVRAPIEAAPAATGRGAPSSALPPLPSKKPSATGTTGHEPKKSLARLSAVGGLATAPARSPVPWWGDDD